LRGVRGARTGGISERGGIWIKRRRKKYGEEKAAIEAHHKKKKRPTCHKGKKPLPNMGRNKLSASKRLR